MGVIAVGLGLQTKEVTKERKRRRNFKKSFTKMNKNRKMKDDIRSKMVQTNPKITEKLTKEGGSRKAESITDKGDEKNNLTRTWSRDPMLAWSSPFSNVLTLDQTIANKLAKLVFSHRRSRPRLLGSPHGHELLVLDHRK